MIKMPWPSSATVPHTAELNEMASAPSGTLPLGIWKGGGRALAPSTQIMDVGGGIGCKDGHNSSCGNGNGCLKGGVVEEATDFNGGHSAVLVHWPGRLHAQLLVS